MTTEELAQEIYSWHTCTQMYAPKWENLNRETKGEILAAAKLDKAERISQGKWLTHKEMQET